LWLPSLKVAQLLRSVACLHTNQSRSYLNHLVIELEGIKRASESPKMADIKIIMLDVIKLSNSPSYFEEMADIIDLIDDNTIMLVNKIDLLAEVKQCHSSNGGNLDPCFRKDDIGEVGNDIMEDRLLPLNKIYLKISIKEKIGLDILLKEIENIAHNIAGLTESPHITRQRQRACIEKALEYLENFNIEDDLVLVTEDVRMAILTHCGPVTQICVFTL